MALEPFRYLLQLDPFDDADAAASILRQLLHSLSQGNDKDKFVNEARLIAVHALNGFSREKHALALAAFSRVSELQNLVPGDVRERDEVAPREAYFDEPTVISARLGMRVPERLVDTMERNMRDRQV